MNLKFGIIIFLFLISEIAFSQTKLRTTNIRYQPDFYILESELKPGMYTADRNFQSNFKIYDFKILPVNLPETNRMLTFTTAFEVDSAIADEMLYLAMGPIDYPCNIFLNNNLIAKRGNTSNGYSPRTHFSEAILLVPAILKYNETNYLTLQIYPMKGEKNPLERVFITNERDAKTYVFYRNLVTIIFIKGFSIAAFILFIFFILLYFLNFKHNFRHYLFFALMNLTYSLAYINVSLSHDFSNTFLLDKITRINLPLLILFTLFFIINYLRIVKKRKLFSILICLLILPTVILQIFADSVKQSNYIYFRFSSIIILFCTILSFLLSIYGLFTKKNVRAIILTLFYFITLIAASHDLYYAVIVKTRPYTYIVPVAMMLINILLFFLMAKEHSELYVLSEKKSLELKYLNENLENLVAQRTSQLKENTEQLKSANATKNKLFSIIAHDLKNMFSGILGYLQILEHKLSDINSSPSDANIVKQVSHIANNTYNLLDNLLNWAVSQTGQIGFRPKTLKLQELVEDITNPMISNSNSKNINFHVIIDNDMTIYGDPMLLSTVIRNLVSNAYKYTNTNGNILIEAMQSREYIEILISDDGIGMEQQIADKLFTQIINNPQDGTADEKGTGIGLIICKEFVEKHNGTISVISEIKKGTQFKIRIPIITDNSLLADNNTKLYFTDDEKTILHPFKIKLLEIELADISEIRTILKEIKKLENEKYNIWTEKLNKCALRSEKDNYLQLLNLV